MSRACYGNYRKVSFLALKKACDKSEVDGISIRSKSVAEQIQILSWWESPISHNDKSWKTQTKNRNQWKY
jgi:hypothetical protein